MIAMTIQITETPHLIYLSLILGQVLAGPGRFEFCPSEIKV